MREIPASVDEYIAGFPRETQALLTQLRNAILRAAPGAEEKISYRMPAYFLDGVLVYFGAYKNHIGFYPTASGMRAFQAQCAGYVSSKGAVQFRLDRPLPLGLVEEMVRFRVRENAERSAMLRGR